MNDQRGIAIAAQVMHWTVDEGVWGYYVARRGGGECVHVSRSVGNRISCRPVINYLFRMCQFHKRAITGQMDFLCLQITRIHSHPPEWPLNLFMCLLVVSRFVMGYPVYENYCHYLIL